MNTFFFPMPHTLVSRSNTPPASYGPDPKYMRERNETRSAKNQEEALVRKEELEKDIPENLKTLAPVVYNRFESLQETTEIAGLQSIMETIFDTRFPADSINKRFFPEDQTDEKIGNNMQEWDLISEPITVYVSYPEYSEQFFEGFGISKEDYHQMAFDEGMHSAEVYTEFYPIDDDISFSRLERLKQMINELANHSTELDPSLDIDSQRQIIIAELGLSNEALDAAFVASSVKAINSEIGSWNRTGYDCDLKHDFMVAALDGENAFSAAQDYAFDIGVNLSSADNEKLQELGIDTEALESLKNRIDTLDESRDGALSTQIGQFFGAKTGCEPAP